MFGLHKQNKQLNLLPIFKNWGHFMYKSRFPVSLGERKSDGAAVGLPFLRAEFQLPP